MSLYPATEMLLAGWSSADITPEGPVLLAGQFHARVMEKVNTPVTATVLALESVRGETREGLIWVSCDLVTISDSFRSMVRDGVIGRIPGFMPGNIILNATHTHTAPEVRQEKDVSSMGGGNVPPMFPLELPAMKQAEYIAFAAARIADAVAVAWARREPSGIGFGLGHAVVGYNRRVCYLNGECRMYGKTDDPAFSHIEGHEDHGVNVLAVWNRLGRLTGVVVNVACPSQATEHLFELSADYWHETRLELRRRFGQELHILAQCSAAGDQSPHVQVNKAAEERMWRLAGRTERQDIGVRIANAVSAALPLIERDIAWAPAFAHTLDVMQLKRRNLTEEDVRAASAEAARIRTEYEALMAELKAHPEKQQEARWYTAVTSAYRRMRWNEGVADRFEIEKTQPTVPAEVHVVRLGDMAFVTCPFEYYLDFGQRIKARSKAVQTFVVQLAGSGTYLPTERAIAGKSYGAVAASTPVGPEGGQQIVETAVEIIAGFWRA